MPTDAPCEKRPRWSLGPTTQKQKSQVKLSSSLNGGDVVHATGVDPTVGRNCVKRWSTMSVPQCVFSPFNLIGALDQTIRPFPRFAPKKEFNKKKYIKDD